jgi:PAS domain S-box-containing protein
MQTPENMGLQNSGRQGAEEVRARLAAIVESSDDAIIGKTLDGIITSWNWGAERLFGYSAEEMIGKPMLTVFPPDRINEEQEILARIRRGQRIDHFETVRVRKGGERIDVSVTLSPIRDGQGNIIGVSKIARDISERKQAETLLAYERDLLNTLLENLPDSIYFKDLESRFVRVSRSKLDRAYAFFKARHRAQNGNESLPPHLESIESFNEYLIGKSDADFFSEADFEMVLEEEQEIIRTGRPIIGRVEKMTLLDGSRAWYLSTKMPWKDKEGNIIGTFGSSQDVTTLKETERRLQSQLDRLALLHQITRAIGERQDLQSILQVAVRSLEDHLPIDFCCVCSYDEAASVLRVICVGNKSMEAALELAMSEKAAVPIDENGLSRCVRGQLVYEPDISQAQFPFPQRLAKAGLRALVASPLLVESKVFGVLVAARRQPNSFSSGECEFLKQLSEHVALASHQAQLYQALQRAYEDVRRTQQAVMQQERLRALGEMASGIAHDINNAISPVSMYTESLLENEPNLSPRAREYLGTIQEAIHGVADTIARMREFYRQREPQLELKPVHLGPLIQHVVDLTRARWNDIPQQRGKVIQMQTELAPDLPTIMGAESEIRDALTNLIFNAVDAMPEGGTLTLRGKVVKSTRAATPRHVQVEVIDTGAGMDDETRRRCLEPFFTTKGERGTGLGLAMVYGMIQRHGADIEIETAVGKGTIMRLSFPVPTGNLAEPAKSVGDLIAISKLQILVVDDDPIIVKSLRDILESDGHVVVTASHGQEGIDKFKSSLDGGEPFAVVITDLGMPHIDGRKVASTIKAASPSTPVIMLTGWGQRLIAEGDIPVHVDRVLSKPPKLRELREALAACLTSKGP